LTVVADAAEAARLVAQGTNVVLIVDADAGPSSTPGRGPGRLAVMVGQADDPEVRAAAELMAAELF
jgi:hypothetical protein